MSWRGVGGWPEGGKNLYWGRGGRKRNQGQIRKSHRSTKDGEPDASYLDLPLQQVRLNNNNNDTSISDPDPPQRRHREKRRIDLNHIVVRLSEQLPLEPFQIAFLTAFQSPPLAEVLLHLVFVVVRNVTLAAAAAAPSRRRGGGGVGD
jgi:hypothetical protein